MNSESDKSGYLNVGEGHHIYFETFGNPEGINILFLHGGPGTGFSNKDKQLFNPEAFNLVLFDQRGTGKSKPLGCLENNTTQKILDDITKLLDHLGIEKTILFGGSWGSTLALLYAMKNPERITGLLLRGIFIATKESRQHFENGAAFFPKVWKRFSSMVPKGQRDNASEYYYSKILSSDEQLRNKYAYELARYTISISKQGITEKEVEDILDSTDFITKGLLLSYFSANNFFLPNNYIINNLEKIENIPVSIVQGKYDKICPPKFAIEIVKKLQNAKLFLVDAGHSSHEPKIKTKLSSLLNQIRNNTL